MARSPTAAEDELRRWAQENARRDEVIREAFAAGVRLYQIQEITGLTRPSIMRILARGPKRPTLRVVGD